MRYPEILALCILLTLYLAWNFYTSPTWIRLMLIFMPMFIYAFLIGQLPKYDVNWAKINDDFSSSDVGSGLLWPYWSEIMQQQGWELDPAYNENKELGAVIVARRRTQRGTLIPWADAVVLKARYDTEPFYAFKDNNHEHRNPAQLIRWGIARWKGVSLRPPSLSARLMKLLSRRIRASDLYTTQQGEQ